MFQAINRSTTAFAIAFISLQWTQAVRAQDNPSDVVTRLGHLEETVRDLTGQVQELQYRNQQLEQQVQRLQEQAPGTAGRPLPGPSRPSTQYSPPPASA
ncbi:MAG: tol-pal system protein YbgF, partial [Xanthobacteraceae bacterium]